MLAFFALALAGAPAVAPALASLPTPAPVRVHVVVALCDVATQGVVPPADVSQCDAQRRERNLYWGALYGVKTHLKRSGWKPRPAEAAPGAGVVERVVFDARIAGKDVVVVADAFAVMGDALAAFFAEAGGHVSSGAVADLIVFVGHDGLMEQAVPVLAPPKEGRRTVAVFACLSERYFGEALRRSGAHGLVVTRDLLAPEGYLTDALVRAFAAGAADEDVVEDVARAYQRFQKLRRVPRRMFASLPR